MERNEKEGAWKETMSRRCTHRGVCCDSNALLWLRNMGLCLKRTLYAFFQE